MKKLILNLSVILAISPFLVHCASQNEVRDLQYQLRIVNKKLEDMKSNTVGMIQKRQADSSGQMSQLEQEIMTLKSQLGETNQLNSQLKEKNAELESAFTNYTQQESVKRDETLQRIEEEQKAKEAKLAELSEKVKVQQESVQAIQDARVREAERRAREAKLAADKAKAKNAGCRQRSGLRQRQCGKDWCDSAEKGPLIEFPDRTVFPPGHDRFGYRPNSFDGARKFISAELRENRSHPCRHPRCRPRSCCSPCCHHRCSSGRRPDRGEKSLQQRQISTGLYPV